MRIAAKNRPGNRKGSVQSEKTKKLISDNNASSKPIKTPLGIYKSKVEAAVAMNTTTEAIRTILNEKIDIPIARKSRLFSKTDIGKTPRELGWAYV